MDPTIIGIKKLYRDLTKIAAAAKRGQSFLVVKHATPIFRIEPVRVPRRKTHTLKDIAALQIKSGDKNLSKKIDKTTYGI